MSSPETAGRMIKELFNLAEMRYTRPDLQIELLDLRRGFNAMDRECRKILTHDAVVGNDAPRMAPSQAAPDGAYPSIQSLHALARHSEDIGDLHQAHNYRGDIKQIVRRINVGRKMDVGNRRRGKRGYTTTAKSQHQGGPCDVCFELVKEGERILVHDRHFYTHLKHEAEVPETL